MGDWCYRGTAHWTFGTEKIQKPQDGAGQILLKLVVDIFISNKKAEPVIFDKIDGSCQIWRAGKGVGNLITLSSSRFC